MCHAPLVLSRTRIRCSFFPAESNRHNSIYSELSENNEKLTPRPSQVAPRGKREPGAKGSGVCREACSAAPSPWDPSSDVVVSAFPLAASASFIVPHETRSKSGPIIEAAGFAAVGVHQ